MIAFLQPLALVGLLAAAIPAVLHLVSRRSPPVVPFPAVRYLAETERRHSRRLKLRHLVLLLLRTALIACVILAAARPVVRVPGGAAHAPTALAVVLDNSLSSGAVAEGRRVLDLLSARARDVIGRVATGDRVWLILADGVPRPVTAAEAVAALDGLAPSTSRLDVGRAARLGAGVASSAGLAQQEVVILSDLQRSALSGGDPVVVPVLAWTPGLVPDNRGVDSAWAEPGAWSPGGAVVATIGGERRGPIGVRLLLDAGPGAAAGGASAGARPQEVARAVAYAGDRVVMSAHGSHPGWLEARVALDPDELRGDDDWYVPILIAEPAAARAEAGAGRYVAEALAVLQEGRRAVRGESVVLGDRPAGLRSIVVPPNDPALIGALNRALAARGVAWRLGERRDGEWRLRGDVGPAEGATIRRRYRLVGSGTVLARAGDEPWLVRDGRVVLLGSRLEDDWTDLPVSAGFVPFVDLLVNRIAAGQAPSLAAHPGDVVEVPAGVDALLTPRGAVAVTGERRVSVPREPGVYFLRSAAGDTVGATPARRD